MSQVDKSRVQRQFGQNAQQYRDDPLFAAGEDLEHMITVAQPGKEERLLDVGTGAGHTALAFAPYVNQCIGLDVTEETFSIHLNEQGQPSSFCLKTALFVGMKATNA
ncbi:MAG: SAM-dependent methyltransferase [Candidatus Carbobacillus altaicus]|uniref:SAM-dependent methyltransferase n=1 Tax=Candidatus Carbonibacillus altaicus TaxID=2163959 RepID=A0A2R6Y1H2_9BACL|nr:MAG: SAM-dependent methyltransferase [Candidatus Carbobacillus altaicus]